MLPHSTSSAITIYRPIHYSAEGTPEQVFPSVSNALSFLKPITLDRLVPPLILPDMTNYSYYPTPETPAVPKPTEQLPSKTLSDAQFWFSVFECTDTTKVRRHPTFP